MRTLTEADLVRLDAFLCGLDDDAMVLSELDGYLAGIIVCPEPIPAKEWLKQIWGERPAFSSLEEANEIIGIVMALHNDIVAALDQPGAYAPRLDEDTDGAMIWEIWAAGFGKALDLNPFAWADYDARPEDDPDAMAIRVLDTLAHAAETPGDAGLPEQLTQALHKDAVDILGSCVEDLHRARRAALKPDRRLKVPRNAPCPCGSGKKYKRCCLQDQET